jgi:hypothetical protein
MTPQSINVIITSVFLLNVVAPNVVFIVLEHRNKKLMLQTGVLRDEKEGGVEETRTTTHKSVKFR